MYWFVVIKTKNNAQLMLASSLLPVGAMVEEFPPTVCNAWDSRILFVSYSCLYFAGTRDPPWLPGIGTGYAVSYKYIKIFTPFPDGDCKSINLVVSNHIYFFRFKISQRVPGAPCFIFSGPFLLSNFSKKLPFWSKGKVLFKYGNLELYWLHSELWNILLR